MKRSLLGFLVFCCFGLFASKPVSIDFEVRGMADGTAKIYGVLGSGNYLFDSIQALKGKAHFGSDTLIPGGLYYFVLPGSSFFQFLLDKDQQFEMKTDTANLVANMKVKGSEDNQLFYDNLVFESVFRKQFDSLDALYKKEVSDTPAKKSLGEQKDILLKKRKDYLERIGKQYPNSFFTYFKLAGQNPELQYPKLPNGGLDTIQQTILYRDAYWKNTPVNDERLLRTPVIANKLKTYITQLIPQTADSIIKYAEPLIQQSASCKECLKFIVNWMAIQYEKPTFMGGEKVLVYLVDKYYTDEIAGEWFKTNPYELIKIRTRANDMRPSLIGMTGQDLNCKNLDGNYERLYDLKTPLKVVFMYEPDCSHCQAETPELKQLVDRWKGKVDVYALCINKNDAKWHWFVLNYGIQSFHNVHDPDLESQYYKKYYFTDTPGIYVLGPNNKIVAKNLHPNQLDEVFEKVLSDNHMR